MSLGTFFVVDIGYPPTAKENLEKTEQVDFTRHCVNFLITILSYSSSANSRQSTTTVLCFKLNLAEMQNNATGGYTNEKFVFSGI
jgi:hypothetical protein